ncbi:MAG TPA: MarR family transcriptional regulator [Sphingobium sp.]|uniref:MarR family winged helix-turn-helix transcriptional regulator n=1 Tax=Sphingobium sp. TaxID=1912891 RepID=UPI002ED22A0B
MQRQFLERELAQRMLPLARGWQQLADQALSELRVSHSTGWCLIYLHRLGPEARQIDLAQEIGISQPSVVRALDQLEAGGLVERTPHPEDRRSNRLGLTPQGKALVGKIEAKLRALRHDLLHDVPDTDMETMLRAFDILSTRIAQKRA